MLSMTAVNLVDCSFSIQNNSKRNTYNPVLVSYTQKETKQKYTALISFDLMGEVEKPSMALKCSFKLEYKYDEEGKKILKEHIVLAHSITYLREFVANITMRTQLPTLLIPPINAIEMWKNYQEKNSK